ncbi:MAG: adenylate/guanylate cyclase domain-containing protein, partial [Anaerolineae bacterium]
MTSSLSLQIHELQITIATLEGQRASLGDALVDVALASLRQKLAALQAQSSAPTAERRLLTILFSDVVDSSSFAERLDPEEWHAIIARLHATMTEIIQAHTGIISQYIGDGLLALFGARQPSESDAENAIRAALDIQQGIGGWDLGVGSSPTLNAQFPNPVLQLRIGIHSGPVVTGEIGTDTH